MIVRLLIILAWSSVYIGSIYAADQSLIDALNAQAEKTTKIPPSFSLQQFESCDEMSKVLTTFVNDNADYFNQRNGGIYGGPIRIMPMEERMMDDNAISAISAKTMPSNLMVGGVVPSSTADFSQTNNQVKGVDEPDIMKTDGKYIYYVNEKTRHINIISSPLTDAQTIDIRKANLINSISIPQSFYNTQLFLDGSKLIIIGSRYRENNGRAGFLDTNNRITVVVFDMSNPVKPAFLGLKDIAGTLNDMRLIDGKLVIVHSLMQQRNRLYTQRDKNTSINPSALLPTTIEVNKSTKTMMIQQKSRPFQVSTSQPACDQISYALPDSATLSQYNIDPSFSIISTIDIRQPEKRIQQSVTIGSTQTIHVSQKHIYMLQSLYTHTPRTCPMNARCFAPNFDAGQQTLIHKFTISETPRYLNSTIITGSPLSQYSMDEHIGGDFRILTRDNQGTNLFILDKNLESLGKLLHIEPSETFQSSRFIDDKLYLVTFEQIDPLFAIDLKNPKNPVILGQLKIPGYSTYLHPYASQQGDKQYLIGLGYMTATGSRGGVINSGIKIDLYAIDYSKKDNKGNISITQQATQTLGGMESQTEATYNPRMFVRDSQRKQLLLPLSLTKTENTQQCTVIYDSNNKETSKECYPNYVNKVIFAGMKLFGITPETGIKELSSYDYQGQIMKEVKLISSSTTPEINPWQFGSYMNRVGYMGDMIYIINQLFADFRSMDGTQGKYIEITKFPE